MNGNKPTYKGTRDLPIYRATYKLLKPVFEFSKRIDRIERHTIGQEVRNLTLSLFRYIRIANDYPDRRCDALIEFLGTYDQIATLLKYAADEELVPKNLYPPVLDR